MDTPAVGVDLVLVDHGQNFKRMPCAYLQAGDTVNSANRGLFLSTLHRGCFQKWKR